MFDQKDYQIVRALANILIDRPEDTAKHAVRQICFFQAVQAMLKVFPHLKPLVQRLFDAQGNLLEDKSDMSVPRIARIQRFWRGLKTGATTMNPIWFFCYFCTDHSPDLPNCVFGRILRSIY